MTWDFSTDDAYQEQLDWVQRFVRDEVEPLELVLGHPCDVRDPRRNALVRPLQAQVRARKLWACHLGPELGGQGYGQVKLALLNELLGRSQYGPTVFGCQAPDSGNAEILAHYGTPEQKRRWLQPLLDNEIVSCFAMTEPAPGAGESGPPAWSRVSAEGMGGLPQWCPAGGRALVHALDGEHNIS